MNFSLEQELVFNNPSIFYNTSTIEVGVGWLPIVEELIAEFSKYPAKITSITECNAGIQVNVGLEEDIDQYSLDSLLDLFDRFSAISRITCSVCGRFIHSKLGECNNGKENQ